MTPVEPAAAPDVPGMATSMRVLVATDGSDHAVKAASFVARMLPAGAKVRLLTVLSMDLEPWTYLGD